MRRLLLTGLLLTACRPGEPTPPTPRPLPPPAPTPAPVPVDEPIVRIGIIVDADEATVGAPGAFEIRDATGTTIAGGRPGDAVSVRARGERLVLSGAAGASGPSSETIRVVAPEGVVTIGERAYRGEAEVAVRPNGRVTVVNVLALEAYLRGVIPREIGSRPEGEVEAVKAQAVAARTYAVGNLRGRARLGFDFFATTQDQVYGGLRDEDAVASRAIDETRGVIATYDGAPILAYYSSTCGGRTANIEDAWPWRAALPYLRSVADTDGRGDAYCAFSNRYRWTTRWTRRELLDVLAQTLPAHMGASPPRRVSRVAVADRSPSGTVSVDLRADGRDYRLRADSTRWILRPSPGPGILNSARILDLETEMRDGAVESLRVDGAGWGHAVGMCQIGAIGRARAGQDYEAILKAYYTGIELTRLY